MATCSTTAAPTKAPVVGTRTPHRRVPRRELSGILLLDKPPGISSNGALQRARFVFGAEKGGHTGNLDVAASGLLPVCFGEATKVSAWLLESDKAYIADISLGVTTTTGDAEGEVISRVPVTSAMLAALPEVLTSFLGTRQQVPPMYSALKREGRPLYELARAGIEVERASREITLCSLQIVWIEGSTLRLGVTCTKGTYIRVLAEDIGGALGCGGSLTGLRRTIAGPFNLANAVPLARFEGIDWPTDAFDELLLPMDSALQGMTPLAISVDGIADLRQGRSLPLRARQSPGVVRIYGADGTFVGLGEVDQASRLLPKRLVRSPTEVKSQ